MPRPSVRHARTSPTAPSARGSSAGSRATCTISARRSRCPPRSTVWGPGARSPSERPRCSIAAAMRSQARRRRDPATAEGVGAAAKLGGLGAGRSSARHASAAGSRSRPASRRVIAPALSGDAAGRGLRAAELPRPATEAIAPAPPRPAAAPPASAAVPNEPRDRAGARPGDVERAGTAPAPVTPAPAPPTAVATPAPAPEVEREFGVASAAPAGTVDPAPQPAPATESAAATVREEFGP